MPDASFDVIVVGAGAVGACSALELTRSGAKVAVVESGEGWAAGCSWGNAGLIVPSHAAPFADLRDLIRATGWLAKPDSPFGINLSPALVPWALRLMYESLNLRRVRRVTALLLSLAHDSARLHAGFGEEGIATGYKRNGLLDVYQTEGEFRRARAALDMLPGTSSHALSPADARATEPLLGGRLAGAVLNPDEAQCDPLRFVPAIGGAAVAAGAELITGFRVTALNATAREVRVTSNGAELSASQVVLATGARASELAPRVPVVAGTGCSIDLTTDDAVPSRPMIVREARVAVTPFDDRVRFAGTMLLAGTPPATIDPRRIDGVYRAGADAVPSLRSAKRSPGWLGARPCTPDGLATRGMDRERPAQRRGGRRPRDARGGAVADHR